MGRFYLVDAEISPNTIRRGIVCGVGVAQCCTKPGPNGTFRVAAKNTTLPHCRGIDSLTARIYHVRFSNLVRCVNRAHFVRFCFQKLLHYVARPHAYVPMPALSQCSSLDEALRYFAAIILFYFLVPLPF